MKKTLLIVSILALAAAGCGKVPAADPSESASGDEDLAGETVNAGEVEGVSKLFVLNEGGYGSNNASLDFLRFSDGKYVRGAYSLMNPSVTLGLGDVGNDIAIAGTKIWIAVNNSGFVEVVSALDETRIASVEVPMPRNIAIAGKYAYVTSYNGAYVISDPATYEVTDFRNPRGAVYKIDTETYKVVGKVEVGYQPEGIAAYGGKLYVANSGGLSAMITYSYDNTLSIIDMGSFTVERTVEVAPNPDEVYSDGMGNIYVTSFGDYFTVPSGLYVLPADNPSHVTKVEKEGAGFSFGVTCSALEGDTLWCISASNEFDWGAEHEYTLWSVKDGAIDVYNSFDCKAATPCGLYVLSDAYGIRRSIFLSDAGDYFNPGTLYCYDADALSVKWSVTTGVIPAHFAVW